MFRKVSRYLTPLLAVIFMVMSVGYPIHTVIAVPKRATEITLTQKKAVLYVKQSLALKVKRVAPHDASKEVTWKSNNTKVATVDSKGNVTAKSVGSAKITAYNKYDKNVKTSCKVTVKYPAIRFASKTIIANVTQGIMLKPEIKGESQQVTYAISSKDPKIATVSPDGYVKFTSIGTVTVTANANGVSESVRVKAVTPTLTINKTSAEIYATGNNSIQLKAHTDGADTKVKWSLSDESCAAVKDGKVVAKKAGQVTVYAKANGLTKSCKVTIKPTALKLDTTAVKLFVKESSKVKATEVIGPSKQVVWKSANTKTVTVKDGIIKAKAPCNTTVTASANGVTVKVRVSVKTEKEQVAPTKTKVGEDSAYRYNVSKDTTLVKVQNKERAVTVSPSNIADWKELIKDLSSCDTNLGAMFNKILHKGDVYSVAGITVTVLDSKTDYKKIVVSGKSPDFNGTYELTVTEENNTYKFFISKGMSMIPPVTITASLKDGMYTFAIRISSIKYTIYQKVDGSSIVIYAGTSDKGQMVASYSEEKDEYVVTYNRSYFKKISSMIRLIGLNDDIIDFLDHTIMNIYYK